MDLTLDFLLPPPPPRLPGTTPRLGCVVRPRPRHDFSDLWSSNHTLVPRHPQAARSPWKQIGQLLLLGKQPLGLIRDLEAVMPKSRCYCGCHMRCLKQVLWEREWASCRMLGVWSSAETAENAERLQGREGWKVWTPRLGKATWCAAGCPSAPVEEEEWFTLWSEAAPLELSVNNQNDCT
ncbi:uncharacterized protein LOC123387752 isoform X5 [Mustela putorius furo]|uniref:Uncharacterized protein LOC123387752 isoform X5 n=1 Tax=Mustela putorius furo TaxID=9669 RepID=A0A8U0UMP4_MUSPF|nr:uncharacterized protein LOC123387752 isoform X5 [Mustela putorius furo]